MSEAALRASVPEPQIDPELKPVYSQLCGIRRRLEDFKHKKYHSTCARAASGARSGGACILILGLQQ